MENLETLFLYIYVATVILYGIMLTIGNINSINKKYKTYTKLYIEYLLKEAGIDKEVSYEDIKKLNDFIVYAIFLIPIINTISLLLVFYNNIRIYRFMKEKEKNHV